MARSEGRLRLSLRQMVAADVQAVAAIAAATLAQGWTAAEIHREATETSNARYFVAVIEPGATIVGFSGEWLVVDMAHVTNMGVVDTLRRHSIGRALLYRLVEAAQEAGADALTLEVRPSNSAARALYEEFGFYVTGERKGYYIEPLEDALIMTTESIGSGAYRARLERIRERIAATLDLRMPVSGQGS